MALTKIDAAKRRECDEKVKNHVYIAKTNLDEIVKCLQRSQMKYSCREVAIAITEIETASLWLDARFNQELVLCVEGDDHE